MVDRGRLDYAKNLPFVNERILLAAPSRYSQELPQDFVPGKWDIICQGGRESFEHIGNRRFRICIDNHLASYSKAKSKHERSSVVTKIVDSIKDSTPMGDRGGFIRKNPDSDRWFEVGDKIAREKVGHALRDAIKSNERHGTAPMNKASSCSQEAPSRKRKRRCITNEVPKHDIPKATMAYSETRKGLFEDADDGDSILNEMAQEAAMDESNLKPQSIEPSNEYNPPGFASLEKDYMTFFGELAPLPGILVSGIQGMYRWQQQYQGASAMPQPTIDASSSAPQVITRDEGEW